MKRVMLLLAIAACGTSHSGNGVDGGGSGVDAFTGPDAFAGPWSDFPSAPILDGTAPASSGDLFGDPASTTGTAGPCLLEPEPGTLFPRNWLRPRFTTIPAGTENLFEIRLTTPLETNPLVVYTTNPAWTMDAAMWALLSAHVVDSDITMAVRGLTFDAGSGTVTSGPDRGTTGPMRIAPVTAPGAIVYWTTTNGTKLRGFQIGTEAITDLLVPADNGSTTKCIGCHSSTPDGAYVGFSASTDGGNGDPTMLGVRASDGTKSELPFLTDSSRALMSRLYQELPVFSKQHWQAGDHTALTMFREDNSDIVWTDLEATAQTEAPSIGAGWGVIARGGDDGRWAASASFAHGDDTILYVSATSVHAGITVKDGNIMTVPYGARAGGTVAPVPGAATDAYNEYYPTFSPDDAYIAYDRALYDANHDSYNNGQSEVYVIPRAGGTPTKIAANVPSACTGQATPGVTNSWPKWAPGVGGAGARKFYWLTFSSTRKPYNRPQLYVTPVVDDGAGTLTTYPALYLWNQPDDESNHTPAWDNFAIIQKAAASAH